jgi:chorismate mutase
MTPDHTANGSLSVLRKEIESVDRSIVLLLAARLDAAQRALRLRVAQGRHVTDGEQERRVLLRSRIWADELGVPPRLIDHLFRSLVEEGKARFLSAGGPPDSRVVTVLLAGPKGTTVHLEGDPDPQLVAVPASR